MSSQSNEARVTAREQRLLDANERLQEKIDKQSAMLEDNAWKFRQLLEHAEFCKYDDMDRWGTVLRIVKMDRNEVAAQREELKREEENEIARDQDSGH